jgi:hypothetical protein
VYGELSVSLSPGWYAVVFGSGLFGTSGLGGAIRNNMDFGTPSYIGYQPGDGFGWAELINPIFRNHRFVINGQVIPEPSALGIALVGIVIVVRSRIRSSFIYS